LTKILISTFNKQLKVCLNVGECLFGRKLYKKDQATNNNLTDARMILYRVPFLATFLVIVKATTNTNDADITRASSAEFVQSSPVWLANVKVPSNVATQFPRDEDIKAGPLPKTTFKLDLTSYPEPNKQPPVNHPEVQEVLKHLDFSKIPNSKPRIVKDWVFDMKDYSRDDPDCWWSSSLCKKPKVSYLPEDISICPNKGTWGLNYDDGPYKKWWPASEQEKEYDQPRFYNYLVEKGKQKATLFCKYIYIYIYICFKLQ